jgi:hypothetical protein
MTPPIACGGRLCPGWSAGHRAFALCVSKPSRYAHLTDWFGDFAHAFFSLFHMDAPANSVRRVSLVYWHTRLAADHLVLAIAALDLLLRQQDLEGMSFAMSCTHHPTMLAVVRMRHAYVPALLRNRSVCTWGKSYFPDTPFRHTSELPAVFRLIDVA